MNALAEKYGDKVAILGYPCNQFGQQEPGSAEEIRAFITDNYDIDFPVFAKVDVNGDKLIDLNEFLLMQITTQAAADVAGFELGDDGARPPPPVGVHRNPHAQPAEVAAARGLGLVEEEAEAASVESWRSDEPRSGRASPVLSDS